MANVEITELIAVLEKIRSEQHPDIPASLIQDIVSAEFASQMIEQKLDAIHRRLLMTTSKR